MRLLIAILEEKKALEVRLRLYGMDEHWDVRVAENGLQAAALLEMERWRRPPLAPPPSAVTKPARP